MWVSKEETPPPDPATRFMRAFAATFTLLHRRRHPQGVILSPEGRGLLLHLAWAGPLTIGELAVHVERAQSVVSESVAVLESHGLLQRVRDPRDRRCTLVWLTERARDWLTEEQEPLDRGRTNAVLDAMDPIECRCFLESYERFIVLAGRARSDAEAESAGAGPDQPTRTPKKRGKGRKP